jgi:outer membrane protein
MSMCCRSACIWRRLPNNASDGRRIAKSALNDALGLPLDTAHLLTTALMPLDLPDMTLEELERSAPAARPEARQTHLAADLARTQIDSARAALLPQVTLHTAFEADRQQFINKGGANWLASIGLRWNLFNGFADKARIAESNHLFERAHADERRVDSGVRLEVRRAWAELRAAQQRIEVAKASMAEATESLRITQNRYAAGISNVTDLLRNETAVLESGTRYLAAVHDERIAATMLELAAGQLSADSEVLN